MGAMMMIMHERSSIERGSDIFAGKLTNQPVTLFVFSKGNVTSKNT